jgi:nucleotide-binding universal stress UspA family protein
VARRSRFPCLFVPAGSGEIQKVLVALDGSDRGINVLHQACDFSRYVGATIEVVTVERTPGNEPLQIVSALPVARSSSLQVRAREILAREGFPEAALAIRRGDIVERVVAEAQETGANVLAVGYHRGGPPGVIEAGSTARRLAHAAPCAVLTIPL